MFCMNTPAGSSADDADFAPLPAPAARCLRAAANHDHQLASRLRNRGKNARTRSMKRRMGHLCVMSARYEARAADMAREAR